MAASGETLDVDANASREQGPWKSRLLWSRDRQGTADRDGAGVVTATRGQHCKQAGETEAAALCDPALPC